MHARTQAFRDDYARRIAPAGYRGHLHALFVAVAGTGMLALTATQLSLAELQRLWWLVPVTLVLANIVEYLVHRHLMHKDWRLLHAMYVRHSLRHHRYFIGDDIEVGAARDLHAVLFPPLLLFFFAAVALAFALPLGVLLGAAAGALFFLLALTYYLAYEVLHLLAHSPPDSAIARSALLRRLLLHHRLHHQPPIMGRGNFNIVFPLGDWLFGTVHRAAATSDAVAPGSTHADAQTAAGP